jgi:hypothetical protein
MVGGVVMVEVAVAVEAIVMEFTGIELEECSVMYSQNWIGVYEQLLPARAVLYTVLGWRSGEVLESCRVMTMWGNRVHCVHYTY